MVGQHQAAAAKEANEKSEAGEWCVPEQPVKAAPGQQCVDCNEYCQREHEPGRDRRHERAQEVKLRIAFDFPCKTMGARMRSEPSVSAPTMIPFSALISSA